MFINKGQERNILERNITESWQFRGEIPGPQTRNNSQTLKPGIGKNSLVNKYIDDPVPPSAARKRIQQLLNKGVKAPKQKNEELMEFMVSFDPADGTLTTEGFAVTRSFFPRTDMTAPNSLGKDDSDKEMSPSKASQETEKKLRRLRKLTRNKR